MAEAKLLKDVQIKTGIVRRYVKEYYFYEKEAQKQLEKINQMKADSSTANDEYTIKKANEILQETRGMLPISAANVKKSTNELKLLIETNADALKETEQWTIAQTEILAAANIQ